MSLNNELHKHLEGLDLDLKKLEKSFSDVKTIKEEAEKVLNSGELTQEKALDLIKEVNEKFSCLQK